MTEDITNKDAEETTPEVAEDNIAVEVSEETIEEINKLKELDIDTLVELVMSKTKEAEDNSEKFLRKTADLDNFKKRTEKERVELLSFANEKLLLEVLPVLDNLERAMSHADVDADSALTNGVKLVIDNFTSTMAKFGLTPIEAKGKTFDPLLHEAVSHIETTDFENDTVTEELQRGYTLNGKVVRHTMVVVANNS